MKAISKTFLAILVATTAFFTACKKEADTTPGTVTINLDHRWGTQVFGLGQNIVTPAGDTANFTAFKYFISNVKLLKTDGTEYAVPNAYYLINEDSLLSKSLEIKDVPAGDYNGVKLTIGVDSAKCVSSIDQRTGALDPAVGAKGMYWAWNSGYIFVKLEGTSLSAPLDSASQKRRFFYHIGGFGGYSSRTINNIKTITIKSSTDAALVNGSQSPEFHLITDVKEIFQNPTLLNIRTNPIVMFMPYSTTIADNYADMIRFDHIHH
jgi:hypothetical protein